MHFNIVRLLNRPYPSIIAQVKRLRCLGIHSYFGASKVVKNSASKKGDDSVPLLCDTESERKEYDKTGGFSFANSRVYVHHVGDGLIFYCK